MFGDINREQHPRSADELNGRGSAGPEPQLFDVSGAGLARGLGARFRPFSEPLGFGRASDQGIIEFPIR